MHTTYGALIIAKIALLVALIGLGWVNRERVIPTLRRIARRRRHPGRVGHARAPHDARRARPDALRVRRHRGADHLRAADRRGDGAVLDEHHVGPAELEMTVEPAKVGPNTVHLYLIDAKTGAQFTATKELTATARSREGHRPAAAAATPRAPATTSSAPPCSAPAAHGASKSSTGYPNSKSTPGS